MVAGAPSTGGWERMSALRARTLPRIYGPLLVLVIAGVALRLYAMGVYSTVVTDYYTGDAGRFIRFGYEGIFEDEWQPAGYPLFLAAIREVIDTLTLTIGIQHLLGVLTGLLLYVTVRRAGGSRPMALVPAGFVLLSGDHLFLEHAFLTETLWMFLLAGGLYGAVRGVPDGDLRWIAAAGAILGLSAITRNVSLVLPAVLALWALVAIPGPLRARLRTACAALVPAVVVVVGYVILATSIGSYSGLGEMSGWSLYSRVGQFADCREFTPPDRTRGLCEARPTEQRPGTFFYYFDAATPARRVFPAMSPDDGEQAGAFARAAILGQPVAYARTVAKDVVRYFHPRAGFDRQLAGSTLEDMSFRTVSPDPANTALYASRVQTRYSGVDATPDRGSGLLESYQAIFRLNGLLLLGLLALTAIGAVRCAGRARDVCVLFGVCAVVLLLLPPLVSSYDGRYSVPPAMLLAVSATLAASALLTRRAGPGPPAEDPRADAPGPAAQAARGRERPGLQTAGVDR